MGDASTSASASASARTSASGETSANSESREDSRRHKPQPVNSQPGIAKQFSCRLQASETESSSDEIRALSPLTSNKRYTEPEVKRSARPSALPRENGTMAGNMVEVGGQGEGTGSRAPFRQGSQVGSPFDSWDDSEDDHMAWRFSMTEGRGNSSTVQDRSGGQSRPARYEEYEPCWEVVRTRALAWAALTWRINSLEAQPRPQSLADDDIAESAGLVEASRAADGDLITASHRCQRVGDSSNANGEVRSSRLKHVRKATCLSPGMPRKKHLIDRWRKVIILCS